MLDSKHHATDKSISLVHAQEGEYIPSIDLLVFTAQIHHSLQTECEMIPTG